jgi:hypothetical protein
MDSLDALGLMARCVVIGSGLKAGNTRGEEGVGRTGKRLFIGSRAPWTREVGEEGKDPVQMPELGCLSVGV